ncbi:head decoration protein [Hansschlegelia zhihuaiae]|uniref:Head decoration protein n=1 Tax=Hansschlegelia zhihuaiae TaxID=405005 RepID=A0A4Q0MGN9_9HYPH|nr:head decoration protein [Hansschlegelia zhihuaiae]RXF72116.1 head decoration protein [Hansschlegelia zhihuaiae]
MLRTHTASAPKVETDVLKWEINPVWSRETGTLLAGSGSDREVEIGTVLGAITGDGAATATVAADAGNTGNGVLTMATPATTSTAKTGVYVVTCTEPATNGGTFSVEDPDGVTIGTAKVGVAYAKQVRFTIADGATDFVAGDLFTITVDKEAPSEKLTAIDFSATDGRQNACGVSLIKTVALDGEDNVDGVVFSKRGSVVRRQGLVWPAGATDDQIAKAVKQLKDLGVLVRVGY